MKAKESLKMFVLTAALLVVSLATSARSYDNQLIYNPIEENGMTVGQTVYKMDGNILANYMKYNYKYDDNKRMIESEALKWNSSKDEWEKDLRINYTYEGKTVTTNYYKWNAKKQAYVLVPEMTVTMDNSNILTKKDTPLLLKKWRIAIYKVYITKQRNALAVLSDSFEKSPNRFYREKADKADNTYHQSLPNNRYLQ